MADEEASVSTAVLRLRIVVGAVCAVAVVISLLSSRPVAYAAASALSSLYLLGAIELWRLAKSGRITPGQARWWRLGLAAMTVLVLAAGARLLR